MIIGICAEAGAGKDTLADYLAQSYLGVKISIADPMKRFLREVKGYPDSVLWGSSGNRDQARVELQTLGTEWGREACGADVWVDYLIKAAYRVLVSRELYEPVHGFAREGTYQYQPRFVVVPDVRYENEVLAIRKHGFVIRLASSMPGLTGAAAEHASEQMARIPMGLFSGYYVNDRSIADLHRFADEVASHAQLRAA